MATSGSASNTIGMILQSPRLVCRGAAVTVLGEENRQAAKCKKLTRFIDDIPELYSSYTQEGLTAMEKDYKVERFEEELSGDFLVEHDFSNNLNIERGISPPFKDHYKAVVKKQRENAHPNCAVHKTNTRMSTELVKFTPSGGAQHPSENVSHTSIGSDSGLVRAFLAEVDPDKPVTSDCANVCSAKSIEGKLHRGRIRSISLSCTSLDKQIAVPELQGGSYGTGSDSDDSVGKPNTMRRHSCELAFRHGRISPGFLDVSQ